MYSDSVKQWNVIVGCEFDCPYCKKSFQAQMKRQKHNCIKCYNYEIHWHPERLKQSLPKTTGDEFIWCCSSSDISFAPIEWMVVLLNRIKQMPNKTFFFQTKNPGILLQYEFPDNVLLGITLETNEFPLGYYHGKAPAPFLRYYHFKELEHPRKIVTIEPVIKFNHKIFLDWMYQLQPERIYIGFDTKKNNLPEPTVEQVKNFIYDLESLNLKVKTKYMK